MLWVRDISHNALSTGFWERNADFIGQRIPIMSYSTSQYVKIALHWAFSGSYNFWIYSTSLEHLTEIWEYDVGLYKIPVYDLTGEDPTYADPIPPLQWSPDDHTVYTDVRLLWPLQDLNMNVNLVLTRVLIVEQGK
ncbi:hypothetical protein Pelo_5170 [Pelomyxa schiedti]|nr:hypothetical protein Pelo_5170 [Pelomyxa schiedti]